MLEIKNLVKTYGKSKVAVNNISLIIEPGQIYGFIGSNGAGKTTTIKSVVGIHDFDEGTITIGGHDIRQEPIACKKVIAYIPDNPDLYENVTGTAYINFIADLFEVTTEKRTENIERFSRVFEMEEHLNTQIMEYSHGMKQKVALIAAFVHEPKLMILDEPFVGLDPRASRELKLLMHEMCDKGGSIFFSTHVLEVAEKLCDHIAIIQAGALVADGPTEQIIGKKSLEDIFMEVSADV